MFGFNKERILDAIKYRRATRKYDGSKKISDEDINFILEVARLSPSSVGSEPWKFLVIQSKALREKLKAFSWGMAGQLDDCSHLIIILAKKNARYDSEFLIDSMRRRGVEEKDIPATVAKYKDLQINDAKTAESERALFDWASKQTYIALGNMMTVAAMIGIDTCPIEGFNYEQMNETLSKAGLFDAKEWGVSVGLTLGYRAGEIKVKSRKPFTDLVKFID